MSFYDDVVNETVKAEYEKKQQYDYDIEKHRLECLKREIYNWLMFMIKEKIQERAKKGEYSLLLIINPIEHIKYTFGVDYSLSDIIHEYIDPIWESLKKEGFKCSYWNLDSNRIRFDARWGNKKDYRFINKRINLMHPFRNLMAINHYINQHTNTKEIEND